MRQPDLFTAATRPLSATQATAPTVSANPSTPATLPAGSGFGGLVQQVRGDVSVFIEQGGHGSSAGNVPNYAPAAPALSLEGQTYLARSQGAGGTGLPALPGMAPMPPDGTALATLQQEFLASIKPWAQQAGQRLGVAPELVAAHAALESGWGQRPVRQSNGSSSYNLFGIKAGGQWQGDEAASMTTEYEGGTALKKTERFRSYPDQASAFHDYASLLLDNPRYHAALNTGSDAQAFAQGLARGGYASDPNYAQKLSRLATRLHSAAALDDKP